MSSIDLGNPKVLKNFIRTRMSEANGEVIEKEKVAIFKDEVFGEFLIPEDMEVDVKKKVEKKKEAKKSVAKKKEVKKEEPKKEEAPVKKEEAPKK